ncbi:sensor domain-containing diguanylate cyclase [Shewanella donghaensis]|uniref:sensor domain-containing diguanylate cyclase n=1 Tax=Shewanella donghaensis TaxID=238836 RepID=UPI0011841598|nr:sensor domain-containing diguanylate cyclase [Shewanella donghaensis]
MNKKTIFDPKTFLLDKPNDLISLDKWQKTVNLLAKVFHAPAGFLVQFTPDGFQVTISSQQSSNPYPAGIVIEPEANIFCRKIVETGTALYVPNAPIDPCWDTNPEVHNDGFTSYLGVPVFWPDGTPFGTFCVMDYKQTEYDSSYLELIEQLKDILESDLALIDLYGQMQQMAITDPLSGINNRRGFEALGKQRITLAQRNKAKLGLCYLDVDNFKHINDNYGHKMGDDLIKHIGLILMATVRQSDVIGRLGGDEFVALVLLESQDDLAIIKQRLQLGFASAMNATSLPDYSVSIGAIEVELDASLTTLLDEADKEMLKNKKRLA